MRRSLLHHLSYISLSLLHLSYIWSLTSLSDTFNQECEEVECRQAELARIRLLINELEKKCEKLEEEENQEHGAVNLQRLWRGHAGRKLHMISALECHMEYQDQENGEGYIEEKATEIQKIWRDHFGRLRDVDESATIHHRVRVRANHMSAPLYSVNEKVIVVYNRRFYHAVIQGIQMPCTYQPGRTRCVREGDYEYKVVYDGGDWNEYRVASTRIWHEDKFYLYVFRSMQNRETRCLAQQNFETMDSLSSTWFNGQQKALQEADLLPLLHLVAGLIRSSTTDS